MPLHLHPTSNVQFSLLCVEYFVYSLIRSFDWIVWYLSILRHLVDLSAVYCSHRRLLSKFRSRNGSTNSHARTQLATFHITLTRVVFTLLSVCCVGIRKWNSDWKTQPIFFFALPPIGTNNEIEKCSRKNKLLVPHKVWLLGCDRFCFLSVFYPHNFLSFSIFYSAVVRRRYGRSLLQINKIPLMALISFKFLFFSSFSTLRIHFHSHGCTLYHNNNNAEHRDTEKRVCTVHSNALIVNILNVVRIHLTHFKNFVVLFL